MLTLAEQFARSPEFVDWTNPVNWGHSLNRGLVSWWLAVPNRMGWGSFTWRDLCRKYNTTLTNVTPATSWVGARQTASGAVRFTGTAAHRLSFGGVSPLTISEPRPCSIVIVYRAATTGITRHSLFNNYNDTNPNLYTHVEQVSGATHRQSLYAGGYVHSSNFTLDTTTYFVYGWTWDASDNVAFYLNGNANGTATRTGAGVKTNAGARFGNLDDGATGGFLANGDLTTARIYNRILPAREMAALATEIRSNHASTLNRIALPRYAEQDAGGGTILPLFNHYQCAGRAD
jgi:hypothetical protein